MIVAKTVPGPGRQEGVDSFAIPFSQLPSIVGPRVTVVFLLAGAAAVVGPRPAGAGARRLGARRGVMDRARLRAAAALHYLAPAFVLSVPARSGCSAGRRGHAFPARLAGRRPAAWPSFRDRENPTIDAERFAAVQPTQRAVDARLAPSEVGLAGGLAVRGRPLLRARAAVRRVPAGLPVHVSPGARERARVRGAARARPRYFLGPVAHRRGPNDRRRRVRPVQRPAARGTDSGSSCSALSHLTQRRSSTTRQRKASARPSTGGARARARRAAGRAPPVREDGASSPPSAGRGRMRGAYAQRTRARASALEHVAPRERTPASAGQCWPPTVTPRARGHRRTRQPRGRRTRGGSACTRRSRPESSTARAVQRGRRARARGSSRRGSAPAERGDGRHRRGRDWPRSRCRKAAAPHRRPLPPTASARCLVATAGKSSLNRVHTGAKLDGRAVDGREARAIRSYQAW